MTTGTASGRFQVLASALAWAHLEPIIDHVPLWSMRGPPRSGTRPRVPAGEIGVLVETSETLVGEAETSIDGSPSSLKTLHRAEQVHLVTLLAAASGTRRGELGALQFSDLDGRILTIEPAVSGE
jgi:integrase